MTSETVSTSKPERFTGLLAISLVVLIYAANFVATRFSLLNGLGSHDLAALRYLVAGLIMLPYFIRLGLTDLGGIGWFRAVIITCLAGSPYMLVFFFGLEFAPAAHGAVLNPAIVPSVVFIAMVLLGLQSFSFVRVCLELFFKLF